MIFKNQLQMQCKRHKHPMEYHCQSKTCSTNPQACRYCLADHIQHSHLIRHITHTKLQNKQTSPRLYFSLRQKIEQRLCKFLDDIQDHIEQKPSDSQPCCQRLLSLDSQLKNIIQQLAIKEDRSLQLQTQAYNFSRALKSGALLIKDNQIISQKKFNGEGDNTLALLEPALDLNSKSSAVFKIGQVAYVGVAFKNVVQINQYGFRDPQNHGCHLVTWDGWVFSHNNDQYNNKRAGFLFCHNDIIKVTLDPPKNRLSFEKNRGEQQFSIQIDKSHPDFFEGNIYFCVALWTTGNEAQILQR